MVSLRRTKNFANDPQTPIFLYTILKQLDLRSINWNEVADGLGISNGHAARMRYSRMRSQFEGNSNQPKPAKPKKENTNTGENKSSKTKAKNKRLLEEEENERLANQRAAYQHVVRHDHDPKKIKVEPQSYMHHPWYPPYPPDAAQIYSSSFWGQPAISLTPALPGSLETPALPPQNVAPAPLLKTEPNTTSAARNDVETTPPTIKQEAEGTVCECDGTDVSATIVKKEPGTTVEEQALPDPNRDSVSLTYPLSRTINAFFGTQQTQQPPSTSTQAPSFATNMPTFSTPHAFSRGSYSPFNGDSQNQNAFPWPTVGAGQNSTTFSTDDVYDKMILNPYAISYQDMLNMPLYRLYSEPSASWTSNAKNQQIAVPSNVTEVQSVEQEQPNNSDDLPPVTLTKTTTTTPSPPASPTTQNRDGGTNIITSVTLSDTLVAPSEFVVQNSTGDRPPAISTVIEVETDSEGEVETCSTTAIDGAAGPKIKKELVEM